ncbi:hypothetical protein CYY_004377 [Polysphondylium violaceum]|uniref:RGS domain-containing protein n=1 Tax=Polysphondylium violaceum TaxID=133409 RepID=A0A8J4PV97_9MYCE|nr:hypothetical protein CYY_004377 [Polysphondylium violaceum]
MDNNLIHQSTTNIHGESLDDFQSLKDKIVGNTASGGGGNCTRERIEQLELRLDYECFGAYNFLNLNNSNPINNHKLSPTDSSFLSPNSCNTTTVSCHASNMAMSNSSPPNSNRSLSYISLASSNTINMHSSISTSGKYSFYQTPMSSSSSFSDISSLSNCSISTEMSMGTLSNGNQGIIIDFSNRDFTKIPNRLPCEKEKIECFNCSRNKISIIPDDFSLNFYCLITLNLDYNKFKKIPSAIFKMESLSFLDISNNKIESIPKEIEQMSSIKELYLGNNLIESIPFQISELTLFIFDIDNNPLTCPPMEIVEQGFESIVDYLVEQNGRNSNQPSNTLTSSTSLYEKKKIKNNSKNNSSNQNNLSPPTQNVNTQQNNTKKIDSKTYSKADCKLFTADGHSMVIQSSPTAITNTYYRPKKMKQRPPSPKNSKDIKNLIEIQQSLLLLPEVKINSYNSLKSSHKKMDSSFSLSKLPSFSKDDEKDIDQTDSNLSVSPTSPIFEKLKHKLSKKDKKNNHNNNNSSKKKEDKETTPISALKPISSEPTMFDDDTNVKYLDNHHSLSKQDSQEMSIKEILNSFNKFNSNSIMSNTDYSIVQQHNTYKKGLNSSDENESYLNHTTTDSFDKSDYFADDSSIDSTKSSPTEDSKLEETIGFEDYENNECSSMKNQSLASMLSINTTKVISNISQSQSTSQPSTPTSVVSLTNLFTAPSSTSEPLSSSCTTPSPTLNQSSSIPNQLSSSSSSISSVGTMPRSQQKQPVFQKMATVFHFGGKSNNFKNQYNTISSRNTAPLTTSSPIFSHQTFLPCPSPNQSPSATIKAKGLRNSTALEKHDIDTAEVSIFPFGVNRERRGTIASELDLKNHCTTIRFNNLLEIIKDNKAIQVFRTFLIGEYSVENIDFWSCVENYKKTENKTNDMSNSIYEEFITDNSINQVNLPNNVVKRIEENLKQQTNIETVFDEAQSHIFKLMESDSYERFKKSSLYFQLNQNTNTSSPPHKDGSSSPNHYLVV